MQQQLSIRKMAAGLGVSKSQVARDAQAGMPMHDVSAARAWRLETHDVSRTKDGRIDRSPTGNGDGLDQIIVDPPTGQEGDDTLDEHTAAFREHRANRERINAERAQLELDQLRAEVIRLEEVNRLGFTAFRQIRDSVLNAPARVSHQAALETDALKIEQLFEAELLAALSTFSIARLTKDADDEAD